MANYVTANLPSFNVAFDGTTLTGSINLKQFCLLAGFFTPPGKLMSFQPFANGNFIPGSMATISEYTLSYTLPAGTTSFNSFSVSLGF